jgi:hypothetical protein
MIEEELAEALRPVVQGHVVNAQDLLVHPQRRPQGDWGKDLPALVFAIVAQPFEEFDDLCGPQLTRVRVQVDCYGRTYKEARLIAYQVNRALSDIGLPGEPERAGRLIQLTPFPDDAEKAYRWMVEHYFWRTLSEAEEELSIS